MDCIVTLDSARFASINVRVYNHQIGKSDSAENCKCGYRH